MTQIDFNKVIAWSKSNCTQKSMGKCAGYVKNAFAAGGCTYVSGDGWTNQNFCQTNGFQCIGDFVPPDGNARAHNGKPIMLPPGYKQQVGDIVLIKHGQYGHMVYAAGPDIDDWVSDFWQKPPGQQAGCGPYCYQGSIEHVQFWRHESCLNGAPVVDPSLVGDGSFDGFYGTTQQGPNVPYTKKIIYSTDMYENGPNRVYQLASSNRSYKHAISLDEKRKKEFDALVNTMIEGTPDLGRDLMLLSSTERYDSNILKGTQEAKTEKR